MANYRTSRLNSNESQEEGRPVFRYSIPDGGRVDPSPGIGPSLRAAVEYAHSRNTTVPMRRHIPPYTTAAPMTDQGITSHYTTHLNLPSTMPRQRGTYSTDTNGELSATPRSTGHLVGIHTAVAQHSFVNGATNSLEASSTHTDHRLWATYAGLGSVTNNNVPLSSSTANAYYTSSAPVSSSPFFRHQESLPSDGYYSNTGSGLGSPSESVSSSLQTQESEPTSLTCPHCPNVYYGNWCHRNLTRHIQCKHPPAGTSSTNETGEAIWPCKVSGCEKTYHREDALLKHERECHPELGRAPAIPRK